MLRCSALMSLFCGVLLLAPFVGDASVFAEETDAAATKAGEVSSTDAKPAESESEAAKSESDAKEAVSEITEVRYAIDNLMLLIFAVLVIFMQAGFAMVESGFNASKNTVNILFKNLMDLCIGVLLFYFIGFNLMYPGDVGNGWFSLAALGDFVGDKSEVAPGKLFPQVDFLFQVAFAATAATIVSGAVAGRMKFHSYLIYSAIVTGLIYPISGMWKWGYGWLAAKDGSFGVAEWFGAPFHDFAGSLVVHAVGGFAGLAAAIVLGPRIGRFASDGKPKAMPGHNLALASLGVFILWVGWYGFNPGSQLVFSSASDSNATMLIATNTTLAAAAGGFAAMLFAWALFKKPDLSMSLNGVLAGLVGITANCDQVENKYAIVIGLVAGVLVVMGILALDKLKIDDPVGAFPVHGLCGVWGGIATGLFGTAEHLSMKSQLVGSLVIPLWAFSTMFVLCMILKSAKILRVSPEEEAVGLDISEHGQQAYTN